MPRFKLHSPPALFILSALASVGDSTCEKKKIVRRKYWNALETAGISFLILLVLVAVQSAIALWSVFNKVSSQEGDTSFKIDGTGVSFQGEELNLYEFIGGDVLALSALASSVVCAALTLLFIKIKKGYPTARYLRLKSFKFRYLLGWIAILVIYIVAGEIASEYFDFSESEAFMRAIYLSSDHLWLLYLSVGVAAPVFEEIFFRGFMFRGLIRSPLKGHGTVWVTTILFTVIHTQYEPGVLLFVFGAGLILGYARLYTRSLYVPVILHIINNTTSLILLELSFKL